MHAGSDVFSYLLVKALIVDEREGNTSTHRLQEKNERLLHRRRCYTTGLVLFKNEPGFVLTILVFRKILSLVSADALWMLNNEPLSGFRA